MAKGYSIRAKFFIALALFGLVVLAAAAVSYANNHRVNQLFSNLVEKDVKQFVVLTEIARLAQQIQGDASLLVHHGSESSEFTEVYNNLLAASADLEERALIYAEFAHEHPELAHENAELPHEHEAGDAKMFLAELTDLQERLTLATVNLAESVNIARASGEKASRERHSQEVVTIASRIVEIIDSTLANEQRHQSAQIAQVLVAERTMLVVAIAEFFIVLAFFGIVQFYLTSRIIRPLDVLHGAAVEIGKGNLEKTIPVESADEIGELGTAFNSMTSELRKSKSLLAKRAEELQRALEKVGAFAAEADAKSALYSLMLASIGDAVIVTDTKKRITMVNTAAEKLLLYTREEMLGKEADQLISFVKKDAEQSPIQVWDKAEVGTQPVYLQIDINVLDKKKIAIPVSAALSPILSKENEHEGLIAVIRDIREQRQLEETRISFISVASHQLRTPLTSMRWFSEMLLAGDAGKVNKEQRHFIERIYQGTDRMINLVSLLLQIARVEARRLKVQPVLTDLKQMTKGVELSLKANFDAKKQIVLVSSTPDELPQLMVDQDIIWQVIQNLLSNASRYSPENSTISVHIAQRDDVIEYAVADKGIGIPEADRDKIFEKFYRAENALRYVPEGSGLGLSLVKSLVEGWGGKIWYESKEGFGTTFVFTIPSRGMEKREGDVSITV